jgi:hypothetical protein
MLALESGTKCDCQGCSACEEGDSHAGSPPAAVRILETVKKARYYGQPKPGHVRAYGIRKYVPVFTPLCEGCHEAHHA